MPAMAQRTISSLFGKTPWICRQCRTPGSFTRQLSNTTSRHFAYSARRAAELEIRAAQEIDFSAAPDTPARIVPASPSYFTGSPIFNDNLLLLQQLVNRHHTIPTLPSDQAPRVAWLKLNQYRSSTGERIAASKYAQLLRLLSRLNKIYPKLRPTEVKQMLRRFERPGVELADTAKAGTIDEYGRAIGVGRRKECSARVYLVEGSGEVLINGKSIVQAFPRLHDRESALWALKISERLDKYNVFALARGGGSTGQAEAITLGVAKALLVHEPALKPTLRRAGCVTRDPRRVERKKPGRLKARKKPAWVKR